MNNRIKQITIFMAALSMIFLVIGCDSKVKEQQINVPRAEKNRSITPAEAQKISRDGFLFGLPVVYINLMAEVGSNVPEPQGLRAPINQFAHYRLFPDAASREIVGINLDTLYSLAWIDVSAEPIPRGVLKILP